ncbi:MAG TPA: hypothetical protein DIT64_16790, partial [Verrucomicrobiales bacterium]|nr:hypothetical protein [Verrucomicrobiales bacterium]
SLAAGPGAALDARVWHPYSRGAALPQSLPGKDGQALLVGSKHRLFQDPWTCGMAAKARRGQRALPDAHGGGPGCGSIPGFRGFPVVEVAGMMR